MADRKLQVVITGDASSLNRAFGQAENATQRLGSKLTTLGSRLTRGFTLPIVAGVGAATKVAIDFESAFAGVTKTVDGTDKQLNKIRNGIRAMAREIPATTGEIAAVAESAGALGVRATDILKFTRTMIDLGETTDLTAEQASSAFARITNVMGTGTKDVDRLGAAIVALGNDGASTESEITEMAVRIAAAGKQVGLTQADVLGLASALSSVGVQAEAGGSAISTVMIEMANAVDQNTEKLPILAEVAGVTTAQFKQAFEKDAAGALTMFVEGLARTKEGGESLFPILEELDFDSLRIRDTLLRLTGAEGLLNDSLETSAKAYKENTALTEEAEKRYKTTAAGIEILRNNVADLAIGMSKVLLPVMKRLVTRVSAAVDWFRKLDGSTKKIIFAVAGFAAALGPLVWLVGNVVTAVHGLRAALTFLAAHPVVLVIAGLVALAAGLVVAYRRSKTFRDAVDRLADAGRKLWDAVQPLIPQIRDALADAFAVIGPILRNIVIPAMAGFIGQIATMVDLASRAIGALSSLADKMSSVRGAISAGVNVLPGVGTVRSIANVVTGGNDTNQIVPRGIGGRARGGNVVGGSAYVVGERGPELFVPTGSGSIKPNYALAGAGDGMNVTININGGNLAQVRKVVEDVVENHRRRNSRHDRTRGAA